MTHIHNEEYLLLERLHERQNELEQRHRLAHLRKSYLSRVQHLIGALGRFFIALGTKMQQVEQHDEPAV